VGWATTSAVLVFTSLTLLTTLFPLARLEPPPGSVDPTPTRRSSRNYTRVTLFWPSHLNRWSNPFPIPLVNRPNYDRLSPSARSAGAGGPASPNGEKQPVDNLARVGIWGALEEFFLT